MIVIYFLLSNGKHWKGHCEFMHHALPQFYQNSLPSECVWLIPGTWVDD